MSRTLPNKLRHIVNAHKLSKTPFAFVGGKPTAYTMGLFHPRIVIASSLVRTLTEKQLEAVVLHEYHHLRNNHLLFTFLSRLLGSFFFFIPYVSYLAKQLKTKFELDADAFAMNTQHTSLYLRQSFALNLESGAVATQRFSTVPIEQRVEFLVSKKVTWDKIKMTHLLSSAIGIAIMVGLAFVSPTQAAASLYTDGSVCSVQQCDTPGCANQSEKSSGLYSSSTIRASSVSSH